MSSDERHSENLQSQASNKIAAPGLFTDGFPGADPVLSMMCSLPKLISTS